MIHRHVRHLIVGAGAMGVAAAYHLARRGQPFLLVEQFALGHDRGSSHGEARITRHSYADPSYARLMPEAFREWRELEARAGQNLYLRTGGVSLGPPGELYVGQVAASLDEIGCPHRFMTGKEWNAASPRFRVPDDYEAVFEPDAGMLLAAKAMALQVQLAQEMGGEHCEIWANEPVLGLDLDADRPTIHTLSHRVTADRLIVSAGAWCGRLIPELADRHRIERQQVLYFDPPANGSYRPAHFPIFIFKGADDQPAYYGMPDISGQGVKIARHGGDVMDPDQDDRSIPETYEREIRDFLATCLPGLVDAPVLRSEICKYTVAPNEDFLVDFLPGRSDVIVASPCSGHGFKFSPLIGRILADLAVSGATDLETTNWRFPSF